jgi:enoyl-CoA hydratase
MPITRTLHDGVALLSLELGQGNAINPAFIAALNDALDGVSAPEVRAVVVTGQGRAFSGGLDLVTLSAMDRAAITAFVDAFDDLFLRVLTLPKPVVAAVNGHAVAGGCILAMSADLRIMAPGPYAIGIHEVLLGIPFPAGALEIARHALPRAAWAEAFLGGKRFTPEEAVAAGLVHRLASERGVVADASDAARALTGGSAEAIAAIKAALLAPVIARVEADRSASRARFVDAWLGAEAQARIGKVRDELLARRAGRPVDRRPG